MAFSQPLSGSMDIALADDDTCVLCNNNRKLKWICFHCGFSMCQRCRDKIHPKIPLAKNHIIIDLEEISTHKTDPESKPDLTRIKCKVHKRHRACLYCIACQSLVCETCIFNAHDKHEFRDIKSMYQINKTRADLRRKDLESERQNLVSRKIQLTRVKVTARSNYHTTKQEIIDNENFLVNEIKKRTSRLLKELDQKWDESLKCVGDEHKKIEEKEREIKKQLQEIDDLLQPSNAEDLIYRTYHLFKETDVTPANVAFQGVPKITHSDKTKIPLILGILENFSIQTNINPFEISLMTNIKDVTHCIESVDGYLWVCDSYSNIIKKFKQNVGKIKSKFSINVLDAAILPNGDLLFSAGGYGYLKLIPSGSTDIHDSVYTVSPLNTDGVHVTCDKKVIVGAAPIFPDTGPRKVIVMNQAGHHEKVFQNGRHNQPLFTYPYRITSNSKGIIAITDLVFPAAGQGRIIVLDKEGGVRNIYTGHPDVNKDDHPFHPRGITTTPLDNFIVADKWNHTLHILNSKGDLITFYNISEMGIIFPQSLSFSTTSQLFIGCGTGTNSEQTAKIFGVKKMIY